MMTQDEQRIALAQFDGHDMGPVKIALEHFKERDGYPDAIFTLARTPDYVNDLNEARRVVFKLNESQWSTYYIELKGVVVRTAGDSEHHRDFNTTDASAAQRCEALCRVLFPERFK